MSVILPLTLVTLTCTGPKPDSTESPVLETLAEEVTGLLAEADGAGAEDTVADGCGSGAVFTDSLP